MNNLNFHQVNSLLRRSIFLILVSAYSEEDLRYKGLSLDKTRLDSLAFSSVIGSLEYVYPGIRILVIFRTILHFCWSRVSCHPECPDPIRHVTTHYIKMMRQQKLIHSLTLTRARASFIQSIQTTSCSYLQTCSFCLIRTLSTLSACIVLTHSLIHSRIFHWYPPHSQIPRFSQPIIEKMEINPGSLLESPSPGAVTAGIHNYQLKPEMKQLWLLLSPLGVTRKTNLWINHIITSSQKVDVGWSFCRCFEVSKSGKSCWFK